MNSTHSRRIIRLIGNILSDCAQHFGPEALANARLARERAKAIPKLTHAVGASVVTVALAATLKNKIRLSGKLGNMDIHFEAEDQDQDENQGKPQNSPPDHTNPIQTLLEIKETEH